jgi:tetratricopeptide (TPR) repeat protein
MVRGTGAERRPQPMAEALRSIQDLEDDRELHAAHGDVRAAAGCDREIGIALAEAGKLDAALDRLTAARSLLDEGDRDVAICDHCLGIVLARLGREQEALQRLESARSAYASLHRYLAVADCEEHIGYALLALDRPGAAVSHLSHARALHDEAGRTDHVEACEVGLSAASGQCPRPRPALDLPRVAPPLRPRLG